ncbi:translocation/assembly module TamB domain-containing protein [Alteromonas oceanisediminis]|uniref:translocation/assembly module TamB domain-containing protein n=1 Tax=Alteromonas oceanisediminis TaxID=2836180 RepID=UPI001BDB36D9|nr:translocation/assembly module TamB domain-containing protein [Alteromonas oceanisediminis]MBT0586216.1 translocation/assembly module TamB domain-containing protein [Alteromonas oceanisediminis]
MIWLKRLGISILIVLILLVALVFVSASRLGTPSIIQFAAGYVEGLRIGEVNGGLTSTITFSDIQFQSDAAEVNVKQAAVNIRLNCLLQVSVCVESLQLDGTSVVLKPTESQTEEVDPTNKLITLPLLVAVDSFLANQTQVTLASGEKIEVGRLHTEIRLYQQWRLLNPNISSLAITVPASDQEPVPTVPYWQRSADIVLPDVFIPLNAVVKNLEIAGISLNSGEQRHQIEQLLLDASARGTDVQINRLNVGHAQGSASLQGNVSLSGAYPLSMELTVQMAAQDMPPVQLQSAINGSVADLSLSLIAEQPVRANVTAKLKPLAATLPVSANVTWEAFNHQSLGLSTADFSVTEGQLGIDGNTSDYRVKVDTQVSLPRLPTPVRLDIDADVNTQRARVRNATLIALGGEIQSSGSVRFNDGVSANLSSAIRDLDASLFSEQLPSQITGRLRYEAQLTDGQLNLNVPEINISASQMGYPLTIAGSAAYAGNAGVAVSNVRVSHVDNTIQGFARLLIDRRVDADLIIAVNALEQSIPGFFGQARGNILLSGSPTTPDIEVKIDATDVANEDEFGDQQMLAQRLDIEMTGSSTDHELTVALVRPDVNANVRAQLKYDAPQWQVQLQETTVEHAAVRLQLSDAEPIIVNPEAQSAIINPLCFTINEDGKACVKSSRYEPQGAEFGLSLSALPLADLLALSAAELPLSSADATLGLEVEGTYSPEQGLIANVQGKLSAAEWVVGDDKKNLRIKIDPADFVLNANQQLLDAEIALNSQALGRIEARATFDTTPNKQTVDATLLAESVKLAPLAFLSPELHRLEGVFDASVTITGDPALPQINGSLNLRDGVIDAERAPAVITDWQTAMTFDRYKANLSSDFKLGSGSGALSGEIRWKDDIALNAVLSGDKLQVSHQDIALTLSPNLEIDFEERALAVNGEIIIPEANILIEKLPPNAVSPSSDVHLRGEPEPTSVIDLADVNIDVVIDPKRASKVKIDAFGLRANLAGNVAVRTQPTTQGFGELQILNGEYRAYGQELQVRTGELQFNGPISQPLLYVEAIRNPKLTENGVIAGVRLEGLATQPSLELFSEPALDQADNLAYLLFGRGRVGGGEKDNNQFAGLLVGFGVSNSETITGSMGEALGINDLSLRAQGSGSDTTVSVSGTIAPDLTLEYGVGVFNSVSEVKLRYQLMPQLYLEAISGLSEALIIYYQFSVGDVNQPSKATEKGE